MNIFIKMYCRTFQKTMKIASIFLPWREAETYHSIDDIERIIRGKHKTKVLLVTDKNINSLGLPELICHKLKNAQIEWTIFDDVDPNPTFENVYSGFDVYKTEKCDSIIALGGGSVMDAAKVIGALSTNNKTIEKLKGLFKVHKKLPLLIAVPTTCGTGSETTIAAVVRNKYTKEKFPIEDLHLIPECAVLDSVLIAGLPKKIMATTALDALTHAVESFIGNSTTKNTRKWSLDATKLIYENLEKAYDDTTDLEARKNLLTASFKAGASFTRSYVGYVHGIAHACGGLYNLPHGYVNAIILPIMLKKYGKSVYKKLSKIAVYINLIGVNANEKNNAELFIKWIDDMNVKFGIGPKIPEIQEKDVNLLATFAYKESTPLYPVPRLFTKKELAEIINKEIRG